MLASLRSWSFRLSGVISIIEAIGLSGLLDSIYVGMHLGSLEWKGGGLILNLSVR